ncbi:MAG: RimK/LysX family protein, partial [Qipengyuania sp.]
ETQRRMIVKTPLRIGNIEFRAEISLADRSDMRFPMLIGRSALRRHFLVDSGHSWLQTPGMKPVEGHKP